MTSIVDAVRQPEYTGENRCMPCTIANTVIAAVLGAAVAGALVFGGLTSPAVAVGTGVAVFAAGTAAIWLRGYLVPKTPELTEKYFPDRVLAYFDKAPEPGVNVGAEAEDDAGDLGEPSEDLDPERALMEAGAVELCEHEEDLCLTEAFGGDWNAETDRVNRFGVETDDIVAALDIEDQLGDSASLSQFGEGVILKNAGREVGKWESQAALVADVAAARTLADHYDGWEGLHPYDRSRLLRGLRIFVDDCPLCDGPITLGQETVESCCRSHEVVAVTCDDCHARLFEEKWDGNAAEAGAD